MGTDLYKRINREYAPLCRDSDKNAITAEQIDRAFGIAKQAVPVSWGGEGEEANAVFSEAVKQVNQQGIFIDAAEIKGNTASFTQRFAEEEIRALVNTGALTVVGIESENGREFMQQNMDALMIKAIQELCTGKNAIHAKRIELTSGKSF